MILRRLATSIRKQDWFAVVIETLIVVMGVFLGLQVNNWNEARQARQAEMAILHQLADAMQDMESEFASRRDRFQEYTDATSLLIDMIRAGEFIEDETELKRIVSTTGEYQDLPSRSAVYEDLLTSGGLTAISNAELRAALARYGDLHERFLRDVAYSKTLILDPHSIGLRAIQWSSDPAAWGEPTTAVISLDRDLLTQSLPEWQALLPYRNDAVRLSDQTLNAIRQVQTLIEAEIAP